MLRDMRKFILLVLLSGFTCALTAQQVPLQNKYSKLSPLLQQHSLQQQNDRLHTWWITTTNNQLLKQWLAGKRLPIAIRNEYVPTQLLVVQTKWIIIDTALLSLPFVVFVDRPRTPIEELVINGFDNSANKINVIHHETTTINGQGTTVSVKENKPDTTDIDFKGRFLTTSLQSNVYSPHATIMSTIITGAGNSYYNGRGTAWGATLSSSDFASLLPDADTSYTRYNISVQNHSYGTGIENYYGADAAAYDASTHRNASLLHVFSAGNSGDKSSTAGAYTGIPGFANLTGSFKMSKNSIAAGAVDSFYNIAVLSSKGPAYDGRIKPELVAFGSDGSSGAAAIVSGTALLLQQVYAAQHAGQLPAAALVKAVLITTADDVGARGPDFESGYGSVHAYKAFKTMQQAHYQEGNAQQSSVQNFTLTVPANTQQLTITVCWNDPPATANAAKALVNDIDMQLVKEATLQTWQPWVLNTFAHPDSLRKAPVRKKDSINNIEQISIDNPMPGNYTIGISGYAITGTQPYAVAWKFDTANRFTWYYPTRNDNLYGNTINTLRWEAGFSNQGTLEYSIDKGANWKLIDQAVQLDRGWYRWLAPDTFATCLLRMKVNNLVFTSDTTTVSARLQTQVGFNCPDSFLLSWNRPRGVNSFMLYRLGDRYLVPLTTVTDTAIVLQKSAHPSLHYTVAPVTGAGKAGLKTFTFNYTTQGAGCYINNFLADKTGNTAALTIDLGLIQGIKRLVIEKRSTAGYITLQTIEPVSNLHYYVTGVALTTGSNTWRLKAELQNGSWVYSEPATVYYLQAAQYLVFPNPIRSTEQLRIVAADAGNRQLLLYNSLGQNLRQYNLSETTETISFPPLAKGMYFILIQKNGAVEFRSPLIIQ
jgi:hypothetical protein